MCDLASYPSGFSFSQFVACMYLLRLVMPFLIIEALVPLKYSLVWVLSLSGVYLSTSPKPHDLLPEFWYAIQAAIQLAM